MTAKHEREDDADADEHEPTSSERDDQAGLDGDELGGAHGDVRALEQPATCLK